MGKNVFPIAAVNTLSAKWWEIWLARLFGKKSTGVDSGCKVTVHKWRNKYYLTDMRKTFV